MSNDEHEYWSGLAILAGAAAALCAALLLCGCSTIRDAVDEYRDWKDSRTNAPAVPPDVPPDAPPATPETPTQPDTPAADEADYSAFTWAYGGFNGSRAALSEPRIASLRMDGMSGLSYRWAGPDLSAWGLGHTDAGALACLFVRRSDGSWIGGKFDWISSSRTTRDFRNLGGYGGWTLTGIPNPTQAAFVIVSADGRRRSNVIIAEWRR
jgi:hypothetical protein